MGLGGLGLGDGGSGRGGGAGHTKSSLSGPGTSKRHRHSLAWSPLPHPARSPLTVRGPVQVAEMPWITTLRGEPPLGRQAPEPSLTVKYTGVVLVVSENRTHWQ